jgi:hypothetical protein
MPKLEYFLVCESVALDRDTNRLSLFHVVEEFRPVPAERPARIVAQLVAVCCWYEEPEDAGKDFLALLRLRVPDGTIHEFSMAFQMNSRRQRLMFHLQGIPSLSPGELAFELLLNGTHKAEHLVTVHSPESAIKSS